MLERTFGRPDPRSVEREVARIVGIVTAGAKAAEIHSDENPAYPRALARLRGLAIEHHTVSSRAARTRRNPLFAINLLDLRTSADTSGDPFRVVGYGAFALA